MNTENASSFSFLGSFKLLESNALWEFCSHISRSLILQKQCAMGKIWGIQGWVAGVAQQTQGSRVAWEPLFWLRVLIAWSYLTMPFQGEEGDADPSCVSFGWGQSIHWSQGRFSPTLLCFHYKLHYFHFNHPIFSFLCKNGLSNYAKIICLFS